MIWCLEKWTCIVILRHKNMTYGNRPVYHSETFKN
jgi:hypothetical protein